ncbi:hypothetical protein KKC22_01860 [Myxococcota bacterium]|nr:hypothetical protein [Myxococcota bacterium]
MNPRALVFSSLVAILASWFGVPPPTWAQTPDDTNMRSLNPDGCRSTDPDYPITYRGQADPLSPAYFWVLPEDPFDTSCGYLDKDADGLLDWAESELAWVFRPYLVFHWDEEAAGRADDPTLNGFTLFYQAFPVLQSMDGNTLSGSLIRLIRLKIVVAFRRDSTHDGDTEAITYEIISHRSSTSESFTKWQLHAINSQGCPDPSFCELNAFQTGNWLIATNTLQAGKTIVIDDVSHIFPTKMHDYLENYGITERGTPCDDSSNPFSSTSTTICLPKVFLSEDKHRPYLFREICNACCHGAGHDSCGGDFLFGEGASMPACWGLPGAAYQTDDDLSGFQTFSDYLAETSIQQNILLSPHYREMVGQYIGNIGEFHYNSFINNIDADTYLLDIRYFNSTTQEWEFFYFTCFGTESDAAAFYSDWRQNTQIDVSANSLLSRIQRVPNPAFIHYTSLPLPQPAQGTCTPLDIDNKYYGFGTLSRQDANYNPLQTSYTGIAGLYANYPGVSTYPAQNEFIWDFFGERFCGSQVPCELALDGAGAAALKYKFSSMTWPNQFEICNQAFFGDFDQDGAPDDFDCDPSHPYLRWDLDRDGHCDEPVPQTELAGCIVVCSELYFSPILTHENVELEACVQRCQGPRDNCSPLVNRFGSPYGSLSESGQCRRLTLQYDSALFNRCQIWFANRDQGDINQNGVGDRCERGIAELRVEVRPDTFGMNQGYFSWCPDPTATVSAFLTRDRSFLTGGMISVGLCVCPGQAEASCRDDFTDPPTLFCPSNPGVDKIGLEDYSMKDFAWDSRYGDFRYFYHPIEAPSQRDLGVMTSNSILQGEVRLGIEVPGQKLLARWRDIIFENARIFLTFRTDQFRQFPGYQPGTMLSTFPADPVVSTHDKYSKLKLSSPQILELDAVENQNSEYRNPTHETWNPEAPTAEYDLLHIPPGTFYYNPEEDDVCIRFPRPVGQPVGFAEGSPLSVDPLWDPPRDLLDPLYGWIRDEDGAWRLFGVNPASFQVSSYVALPSAVDLRLADVKILRVDAALVGGAVGTWATVAVALDRGTLFLREPLQPGDWTQVPTALPANQTVLAFHQASSDSVWVIQRQSVFSAPVLSEVHLTTGAILRQSVIEDWSLARVESMAAPRMGEAYFLIKRPAHLLPNLWKLDKDGLRPDLALPAVVPPDHGALAMDGRMGKLYLVARAAADRKASLWEYDMVTKTWSRLSAAVPAVVLREPRLAFTGGRLVFSDLKDGRWWEWTQGRWVDLGNPLTREVGP